MALQPVDFYNNNLGMQPCVTVRAVLLLYGERLLPVKNRLMARDVNADGSVNT